MYAEAKKVSKVRRIIITLQTEVVEEITLKLFQELRGVLGFDSIEAKADHNGKVLIRGWHERSRWINLVPGKDSFAEVYDPALGKCTVRVREESGCFIVQLLKIREV